MTNLASKKSINVAFAKLALANENLRSAEAADPFIPKLAETLINEEGKSLQLIPLFVKPQTNGLYEILDGRRRWMAYAMLAKEGRIPDTYQIRAIVCDTEAEIAQAVIIANTERLATSEADELMTLSKLLTEKFTVADMARALGRSEKDIRQKLVLAKVDPVFLAAYKAEKISYRSLRDIARQKDEAFLESLKACLQSRGSLYDHETRRHEGGMTEKAALFNLISVDEYVAAGGRIEHDLLEELPGKILDPDIALNAFDASLAPTKAFMTSVGIEGLSFERPDWNTFRNLPWHFKSTTSKEELDTLHDTLFGKTEAEEEAEYDDEDDNFDEDFEDETFDEDAETSPASKPVQDSEQTEEAQPSLEERVARFNELLIKKIQYQVAKGAPLNPRWISLSTDRFELDFYYSPSEMEAHAEALRIKEAADRGDIDGLSQEKEENERPYRPTVKLPPVDTKGYSNAHHERTTRMSGNALSVSLRTVPLVALALQIATQLRAALRSVTNYYDGCSDVLTVQAKIAITGSQKEDAKLTRPLIDELNGWKSRFIESEKTHLAFVLDLPLNEMLELLALLTALQVDLTEIRTDYQQSARRQQAVEVAEVLGHRFEQIMIPDVDYFRGFKKPALLSFIRAMGIDSSEFEKLKTAPLQEAVAELAQEHHFVPPHLNPMVGVAVTEVANAETDEVEESTCEVDQDVSEEAETEASIEDNEIAA